MNDSGTTSSSIRYDSTAEGGDERHSIQTYVSDMLALERHIGQPLQRQVDMADTEHFANARTIVSQLKALNEAHVTALSQCLTRLGGHEGDPIKSGWSALLGVAAGAIDSVRKTKVSKALRDDYTALSLAAISYQMLQTTALGVGDQQTADLATRHLEDYAKCIMTISQDMHAIVLTELRADGENVGMVDDIARERSLAAWKSASRSAT